MRKTKNGPAVRRGAKRAMQYVLMVLVFVIYMLPIFWIILTSFNHDYNSTAYPPRLFRVLEWTLKNYTKAFGSAGGMRLNFQNSVTISALSSVLAMIIGTPAAYALSRFTFRSNTAIYLSFMASRIAPATLIALPIFIWSRHLQLFDTIGLMVTVNAMTSIAWVVWMMRSFFDDVAIEIDEAAMIDGCSRISCLLRVIVPLSKPGLAATMIFCVITSWNEYFYTLVLTSVRAQNLPAALNSFISIYGLKWGEMCAAATVIMLPILLFVMFLQKYLIKGLTVGAVKG